MSEDQNTRITIECNRDLKLLIKQEGARSGLDKTGDIYRTCLELGYQALKKMNNDKEGGI